MTVEEKAKAYDKALEKARQLCAYPTSKPFISDLQDLFPELKESEDETVIAALKSGINGLLKKEYHLKGIGGISFDRIIAWLERQVEQKSASKLEPKFKVGDVIRLKGSAAKYTIKRVTDTTYYTNGWSLGIEKCEEDYELVEQKPTAWSEEDEVMFRKAIITIDNVRMNTGLSEYYQGISKWLEFLKNRHTWKPSDEQLKVLKKACDEHWEPDGLDPLYALYQDLKKLKGK